MMPRSIYLLCLVAVLAVSCREVAVTGRKQVAMLPEDMLLQISRSNYQSFLLDHKKYLLTSGPQHERVLKVGKKLATATETYLQQKGLDDRAGKMEWVFHVLDNDTTAYAWCLPDGKMMISTGLLQLVKTELGLAVLMAHEIAHSLAHHGNERISQMMITQTGFMALDIAVQKKPAESRDLFFSSFGLGTDPGSLYPYSRKHESEADRLSAVVMAMAGYDPGAAVSFWKHMAQLAEEKDPPRYVTLHPASSKRLNRLKTFVQEARSLYQPTP